MSRSAPSFQFCIAATSSSPVPRFGPRQGAVILRRPNGHEIRIDTPNLLVSTSRGVVPHLTRDHSHSTKAIKWVNVPFETFLELSPPVPTIQPGPHALHKFLCFSSAQHILSMSARNPSDGYEMPPNGNNHITLQTLRGVRRLVPSDWAKYIDACQPDVVFALSDIPLTSPPNSQKRLTKSIERSKSWLLNLLSSQVSPRGQLHQPKADHSTSQDLRPGVLVHMVGSTNTRARRVFAEGLLEKLEGRELEAVAPLGYQCLDDGISGYSVDLVPLRRALEVVKPEKVQDHSTLATAEEEDSDLSLAAETIVNCPKRPAGQDNHSGAFTSLIRTSLSPLPSSKLRLVNSPNSPHEILRLIGEVGVDLLDASWAVEAASVGVALDFKFPISNDTADEKPNLTFADEVSAKPKRRIGHNLYQDNYRLDFSPLADSFVGAATAGPPNNSGHKLALAVCLCAACSPVVPTTCLSHDGLPPIIDAATSANSPDRSKRGSDVEYRPATTRAYVHHLLHTHEMLAHTLLVMHNLTVVDMFLQGVREVLASKDGVERFWEEVRRFESVYVATGGDPDTDEGGKGLIEEARECWKGVDLLRGKGRLKRERLAQANGGVSEDPALDS